MNEDSPFASGAGGNPNVDSAPQNELALPGTRLAAYLLDGGVSFALALPAGVLGYRFAQANNLGQEVPGTLIFAALLAVVCLAAFSCYQMYLESTLGQTLGKRWMKVRMVALDGSNPGFTRAILLRRGVPLLIYLGAVMTLGRGVGYAFLLVDLLAILGPARRCLHDRIAGTRVVPVAETAR